MVILHSFLYVFQMVKSKWIYDESRHNHRYLWTIWGQKHVSTWQPFAQPSDPHAGVPLHCRQPLPIRLATGGKGGGDVATKPFRVLLGNVGL